MQNMGAELPVERICQPKPCLCTTHQIWGVYASTGVHGKYDLLGVLPPYFGAELGFNVINECKTVWGVRSYQKKNQTDFYVSGTTPNLGIESQDDENQRSIFVCDNHPLNLLA